MEGPKWSWVEVKEILGLLGTLQSAPWCGAKWLLLVDQIMKEIATDAPAMYKASEVEHEWSPGQRVVKRKQS